MKLVQTDNFNRENVSEILIADNIQNKTFAEIMKKALNEKFSGGYSSFFCKIVEDDYKLYEGEQ